MSDDVTMHDAGMDGDRLKNSLEKARHRRCLSHFDAQVALMEALGFNVGDGVAKIVLTIEANEMPLVEVTFCGEYSASAEAFIPFVQQFDLVRRPDVVQGAA